LNRLKTKKKKSITLEAVRK